MVNLSTVRGEDQSRGNQRSDVGRGVGDQLAAEGAFSPSAVC